MGLKFNNGNGAGLCDECSKMLWVGHVPKHTPLAPFNFYKTGEMYCRKHDPYLKAGLRKEVEAKY